MEEQQHSHLCLTQILLVLLHFNIWLLKSQSHTLTTHWCFCWTCPYSTGPMGERLLPENMEKKKKQNSDHFWIFSSTCQLNPTSRISCLSPSAVRSTVSSCMLNWPSKSKNDLRITQRRLVMSTLQLVWNPPSSMHARDCAYVTFAERQICQSWNCKNVYRYSTEKQTWDFDVIGLRFGVCFSLVSRFFFFFFLSIPWHLIHYLTHVFFFCFLLQVLLPSVACAVNIGVVLLMRTQDWVWLSPSLTSLDTSMLRKV